MQATTYTLSDADETEVPIWDGIGGVPYYVLDVAADTLRLPDTRGMYAEDAGFDDLAVGGAHGDMIRNIEGSFTHIQSGGATTYSGAFDWSNVAPSAGSGSVRQVGMLSINSSRVVPIGNANKPRGYGMLGCIYAG